MTNDFQSHLKRISRALNAEAIKGNGFYVSLPEGTKNIRCNRARVRAGKLEVREIGEAFVDATAGTFCTCYGEEITGW